MASRNSPIIAKPVQMTAHWLEEPKLSFAEGNIDSNPKVGINLYGPHSFGTPRHRSEIHFGFIGSGESIEESASFYKKCAQGIDGDENHEPFPGCDKERGFRVELKIDTKASETISASELDTIKKTKPKEAQFQKALDILDEKLRLLKQKDRPIDYVVFAIPPDFYDLCRVADYKQSAGGQLVHRDLRRAFKVLAMKHKTPTQIIRDRTVTNEIVSRDVDHISTRAWNLFTGMYFKSDGIPWTPTQLDAESCYVGISFYHPNDSNNTLRTSLAQAFDDQGQGFVLRGREFEWDENKYGRAPHLSEQAAAELILKVIEKYKEERKTAPKRVVVHKSSEFREDELAGFKSGLAGITNYDLVTLRLTSQVRLIREGSYPPLRGTTFRCGDITHLYTTGYIKELELYPHGHVPSPVEICDHYGDSSMSKLTDEILILTKMNWNSANYCGSLPITLRFSRIVGDILREVPSGFDPLPKYLYYM